MLDFTEAADSGLALDAAPPVPGTRDISVVAFPDAVMSTMSGIFDVLNMFDTVAVFDDSIEDTKPFRVRTVSETPEPFDLASGMPFQAHASIRDIDRTDIIIAPAVLFGANGWVRGRYPELVGWIAEQHEKGAMLCSACSGIFLLAETGLFDGVESSVHWGLQHAFKTAFPDVPIRAEEVLVVSGARGELVTSGASNTWHDLVLYIIARHASPAAAQSVAKFFALQWHRDGLAHYMPFTPERDHGDAAVEAAQDWIETHFSAAAPVEEMARRSGLAERTFKRRFSAATGHSPIAYVQRIRVEQAKARLERSCDSVEEIGWAVGYEDASAFRRVFQRIAGITPAGHRRKFKVPEYGH